MFPERLHESIRVILQTLRDEAQYREWNSVYTQNTQNDTSIFAK